MLFLIVSLLPALVLAQIDSDITDDPAVNATEGFFRGVDLDSDGLINRADIDKYFFDNYDLDDDQEISNVEFDTFINTTRPYLSGWVNIIFDDFDLKKDGNLDDLDFTIGFTAADSNNDDVVSRLEFYELFLPVFQHALNEI